MERVVGIGGTFIRARDPQTLAAWYRENLGLQIPDGHADVVLAASEGDQTVWAAFAHDTTYFGSKDSQFMLNYRVHNLDAMRAQLRASGADVDDNVEIYDYGKFGWATDPEGNRFGLWEPTATTGSAAV